MPKPGRREYAPSEEIARFTDREDQQELFRHYLHSATEPPVLVFYGVGGAGKSWLLKKLRMQMPADVPQAFLDFDTTAGGQHFVLDPAAALYEIRQQWAQSAPRFDLAFAMMRHKQGVADEPGFLVDLAAELAGSLFPGAGSVLKMLSTHLLERLKGTSLEHFLANAAGRQLVLELQSKTSQEIDNALPRYLVEDLRASLKPHLNRAVSAVLFFDTFEAVGSGLQNEEHRRQHEKWIRDLAANFDFALVVIAGQNRLPWDEADPAWKENLDQRLVGGLAESDARRFLNLCDIPDAALQDAILVTAQDAGGGYHCFSLGLCVDIVFAERNRGQDTLPETLRLRPRDWEQLARRFLRSLPSDAECRWIERLALTPKFDEAAGRAAFSQGASAAQDSAWESVHDYSFVEQVPGPEGWFSIRSQMRWALKNQPSASERVRRDHVWWQQYWTAQAVSSADRAAAFAWYHQYCLEPETALKFWNHLAASARNSVPPRMKKHLDLLQWWEPVGLFETFAVSHESARALMSFGFELWQASLGSRESNLLQAIACYEAASRVYTERDFPQRWVIIQSNLGGIWSSLPTGNRAENLRCAIAHYEAAMRVQTENDFSWAWAITQNNLGGLWLGLLDGDRTASLQRAITCYEAALRVLTEENYPQDWAMAQNNLGLAWSELSIGDRAANLRRAIACYEAALRVRTEQDSLKEWATTQNNLGLALMYLPAGDQAANKQAALAHYEAASHFFTEQNFPQMWATIQSNLGLTLWNLRVGSRMTNLRQAIAYYEAALRIFTHQDFPEYHKIITQYLQVANLEYSRMKS